MSLYSYSKARAIQELAKKRFEKLRVVSCNEMELESLQKIRPNSMERKPMKKSMSMSAQEPVGSDFSSGATLANTRDTCTGPNTAEAVAFDKSGSVDGFVMDGNSFLEENKHVTAEELSGIISSWMIHACVEFANIDFYVLKLDMGVYLQITIRCIFNYTCPLIILNPIMVNW